MYLRTLNIAFSLGVKLHGIGDGVQRSGGGAGLLETLSFVFISIGQHVSVLNPLRQWMQICFLVVGGAVDLAWSLRLVV